MAGRLSFSFQLGFSICSRGLRALLTLCLSRIDTDTHDLPAGDHSAFDVDGPKGLRRMATLTPRTEAAAVLVVGSVTADAAR